MYKWTFEQAKKIGVLVDDKEYLIVQDGTSEVMLWNSGPAFSHDSRTPYGVAEDAIVIDIDSLVDTAVQKASGL